MSNTQAAIARAVRVQLARSNRSQSWLAGQMGISPQALSAQLGGTNRITTDQVDEIAKALGLADGFALVELAQAERAAA